MMGETVRDKLELLIRIVTDLADIEDRASLIRLLITNALEFTGAERGYLVLRGNDGQLMFFDASGSQTANPEISLSTLQQVFSTGKPVNLIEGSDGESIMPTASILALNLKTIMCAPLYQPHQEKDSLPFAALYVDGQIVSRPFSRQDLDFFSILADHAAIVWKNLELHSRLTSDFRLLHDQVRSKYDYHRIVGQCAAMKQVYRTLEILKKTDLDVLIVGETGTGKELIAKAIHYASRRSETPLRQLNCAALPEGLVEAELFGVERNVATEVSRRNGKIEQAQNGTLFLDEIGDMPVRVQNRLLRFLETRSFRRIGGREEIAADVRVLAATNKDLDNEIKSGRFRDALRYRLEVVSIKLPPLRDRGDDLALLAEFFLNQVLQDTAREIQGFTVEAWDAMRHYPWPGNVRELKHRVQAAAFLAKGVLIDVHDLGLRKSISLSEIKPLIDQKREFEARAIDKVFRAHRNQMDASAEALGIGVDDLKKRMAALKIKAKSERHEKPARKSGKKPRLKPPD